MVNMTPVKIGNIRLFDFNNDKLIGFNEETLEVGVLEPELVSALKALFSERKSAPSPLIDLAAEVLQSQGRFPEFADLIFWSNQGSIKPPIKLKSMSTQTITINATQLCNLKCTYCAAGGDGTYGEPQKKLDVNAALPQIRWLMNRQKEGGVFQIQFIGGEPLLYPEVIADVAEMAREIALAQSLQCHFGVVTNGTQFTNPKVIAVLTQFKMGVTVSLDGPPEVQDQFRLSAGGRGSSELIHEGLPSLFAVRQQLSGISFAAVFHRESLDVLSAFKYFLNWDFDQCELTFSHTEFDPQASQQYSSALKQTLAFAYNEGGELLLRKIRSVDQMFSRLDEQRPVFNFCGAGKSTFSLDAKGHIFACQWDIGSATKRLNSGIGLDVRKLQSYESDQVERNICQSCWARSLCGGGCQFMHNQSPGMSGLDSLFCERMKSFISEIIFYYQSIRSNFDETH